MKSGEQKKTQKQLIEKTFREKKLLALQKCGILEGVVRKILSTLLIEVNFVQHFGQSAKRDSQNAGSKLERK